MSSIILQSKINTDAKCCNIWSLLYLHLAVSHSYLSVMGDSTHRGREIKYNEQNSSQNAPIYIYIYVYGSI